VTRNVNQPGIEPGVTLDPIYRSREDCLHRRKAVLKRLRAAGYEIQKKK